MNINLNVDAFVSRLRNTVSSVAHQVNTSVNTIIPGNPVHRDYEILRNRCAFGCPDLIWQVHDAVKRDHASIKASLKDAIGTSSKPLSVACQQSLAERQLYTAFVFDKSQLDLLPNKAQRDTALENIKRSVTQLTRLKHPSILTVHHPLEESRSSLAFVTEHVYGHLGAILSQDKSNSTTNEKFRQHDLVDLNTNLGPNDSDYMDDNCQLDDVQIKAGLLQICDGLRFLHNSAQLLHRNLCLETVFVDSNNTWKIAGFDFCCSPSYAASTSLVKLPTIDDLVSISRPSSAISSSYPSLKTIYSNRLPNVIVPNWSCSAPEHSNSDTVTTAADIYSLGVLSCALLSNRKSEIDLSYDFGLMSDTYKRGLKVRELADNLSATVKSQVFKFASINADSRPSINEFESLGIFQDLQVQAIRDLDSQFAWDRLKKIDFFNRLRDILPRFSHQVKINRITKSLLNELVSIDMMPHVLPNLLIIVCDSTPTEFKNKIFPGLKPALRILEPRTVPLMLLDNFKILFDRSKLCLNEMQESGFKLVEYLLDMDSQIQEKCFAILPTVKEFIDDASMSKILLPKLGALCHKSINLNVRVRSLECIGKLVPAVERWTFVEVLLPILTEMPASTPEMIMAMISVIKLLVAQPKSELSKEIVACKLLPFIVPLSVCKDLSLQQFQSVMELIRSLLSKVEKEQRDTLARKSAVGHSSSKNDAPLEKSSTLILENYRSDTNSLRFS